MLTSNSSGTVIPLPDSPSPLPWNPTWLPISLLPPNGITPFKIITTNTPKECLQQVKQLLIQEPSFKNILVGVFSLYDIASKKFKCRIYTLSNQNRYVWNQWKNNTPNDNINGIFYIYRPWYSQTNQPTPLPQDKQALVWMIPNDPLPNATPDTTSVSWACPLKINKCKKQDVPTSQINLTYRDNLRTNNQLDPCFMNDKGCRGELNILNRGLTKDDKNCPNIYMPFTKKSCYTTSNNRNRFEFMYTST